MGYPSSGFESLYRNSMEQVKDFLDSRHKQNYKVYNLCCEKDKQYPNQSFPKMATYGFHDHNPPSIDLMDRLCIDMVQLINQRNHFCKRTSRI